MLLFCCYSHRLHHGLLLCLLLALVFVGHFPVKFSGECTLDISPHFDLLPDLFRDVAVCLSKNFGSVSLV